VSAVDTFSITADVTEQYKSKLQTSFANLGSVDPSLTLNINGKDIQVSGIVDDYRELVGKMKITRKPMTNLASMDVTTGEVSVNGNFIDRHTANDVQALLVHELAHQVLADRLGDIFAQHNEGVLDGSRAIVEAQVYKVQLAIMGAIFTPEELGAISDTFTGIVENKYPQGVYEHLTEQQKSVQDVYPLANLLREHTKTVSGYAPGGSILGNSVDSVNKLSSRIDAASSLLVSA